MMVAHFAPVEDEFLLRGGERRTSTLRRRAGQCLLETGLDLVGGSELGHDPSLAIEHVQRRRPADSIRLRDRAIEPLAIDELGPRDPVVFHDLVEPRDVFVGLVEPDAEERGSLSRIRFVQPFE